MALSADSARKGATNSRILNSLSYAIANDANDVTTAATGDKVLLVDVSDDYQLKYGDAANILEVLGQADLSGLTATVAEINRSADASARLVTTTATALSLTVTEHAERVVLINTNSTVANTFTLPTASGSGVTMKLVNGLVQTQGSIVVTVTGTDVIKGKATMLDSTAAADAMVFVTSSISDTITFNLTTKGGLGYDTVEAIDIAANVWLVDVVANGSGSLATPFSGS